MAALLSAAGADPAAGQVIAWGYTTFGVTNVPPAATNVTGVAVGYYAALALRGDASLAAWGNSSWGLTNIPASATNVTGVAAGYQHSLALRSDGTVVGWGDTYGGKTVAPAAATNVTRVAAGYGHSLALRRDGNVVAWGSPGPGSPITNVPAAAVDVLRIAAGGSPSVAGFSLALCRDGTVVPWGVNNYGLLTPPGGATNLIEVAAGADHALGLRADGTVVGWGNNGSGACVPPAAATNLVAVAAGAGFSLGLRNDGKVLAWGSGTYGLNQVPTNAAFGVNIAAGYLNAMVLTNAGPPCFVDALGSLIAYRGRDFTLNALAVGQGPLSYQWRYNDTDLPGANQPTLTLRNVQFENAGTYSVVVSNAQGAITGLVATVAVQLALAAPAIQQQPQSQTAFAGSNIIFSLTASGNPEPAYQWQFNNASIPGATNSSYSLAYVLTNQAGNYRVLVSNSVGVATSQVAVLTVNQPNWALVTSYPPDQAVSVGAPVTLRVIASGPTPITYRWQLNGADLPGVTGPCLTLGAFNWADAGLYSVTVSNAFGSSVSPSFQVAALPVAAWGYGAAVTNLPGALTNAVAVAAGYQHALALKADGRVIAWGAGSNQVWTSSGYVVAGYGQTNVPAGLSNVVAIAAGDYHNLALQADGTLAAWGRNHAGQASVPPGATNVIAIAAGSAHSLALRADGTVLAWGTNNLGQSNVPAAATNVVAIAAHQNHSLALRADGTAVAWGDGAYGMNTIPAGASNLIAIAAGDAYNIGLRSDGHRVQWGSYPATQVPSSNPGFPGADTLYDVTAVAAGCQHSLGARSAGNVTCFAGGSVYSTSLQVNTPAWVTNAVAVAAGYDFSLALVRPPGGLPSLQTAQRLACLGGPAVFAALSAGQRSTPCQWRFNGASLPQGTNSFLALSLVDAGQAGDYDAVVMDAGGAVTSSVVHLAVTAPPLPLVVQPPASQTAGAGTNVSFTVSTAYGTPVAYQWLFNGSPIAGATTVSLSLSNIQTADMGDYSVVLTNWSGAVTSPAAALVVTSTPPRLVLQPQNQAVAVGMSATFATLAAGSQPFCYQWQVNGADLPGATNATLTLSGADNTKTGWYHVVVSNLAGAVTSADATLSLTPAAVWGDNSFGQGNVPPSATNLLGLACGGAHVLALRDDGTVLAWGNNGCGQSTVPANATNVVRLAAGEAHSLAVRCDGTLLGWGNNNAGQAAIPAGLSNVLEIAAGTMHSLALKADGTVCGWGSTFLGSASVPAGLSNVTAVAAGGFDSLALRADGTLAAWGWNSYVPPQATNVIAIAAGFAFEVALRADGTLVAWGQLSPANNPTVSMSCGGYSLGASGSAPTNPIALPTEATNIVAIAAGKSHILALRADGTVIAWGDSGAGQITLPPLTNVIAVAAGGSQSMALEGPPVPRLGFWSTNLVVAEASALTFNAAAAGALPRSACWQFNGTNLDGATNLFCFLPDVRLSNAGLYTLLLTNATGAAAGSISLTVTAAAPAIVLQPTSQLTGVSSNVTLRAGAIGSQPLAYQWLRDGQPLTDGPVVSGALTPTLNLVNVQTNDSGNYQAVVSNVAGTNTSTAATVTVLPGPPLGLAVDAPQLDWSTGGDSLWRWNNATTHDGTNAAWSGTFTQPGTAWVQTTVTGPVTVGFWWKLASTFESFTFALDGINLASLSNSADWQQRSFWIPDGTHELRWSAVKTINMASWTLDAWLDQVSLGGGTAPTISAQPVSATNCAGAAISFNVAASGTEPFSYQWLQDGSPLPGATNTTLTLASIAPTNSSAYQVLVTNIFGACTSQVATISVTNSAPTIKAVPASLIVAAGLSAGFSSTIYGTQPMGVRWQFNRADLPGANGPSLWLSNVQPANAGPYRVVANNDLGTTFSTEATLTVVPVAAWGYNASGQTRVPANVGDVVAVAGGYQHSLALRRDGTVAFWGSYSSVSLWTPATFAPGFPLCAIAAAGDHDLGLRPDGTVAAWGVSGLNTVPPDLTNVVAVAAGNSHNLALKDDGTIIAWGSNRYGQTNVPPAATNIVALAGGARHSLALREDGTVLTWGTNDYGQLDAPADLTNAVAIAAGDFHSLALRADGTVAAWGDPANCSTNLPPDLTNIVAVAAGEYQSLALRSDGTVVTWGRNYYSSGPVPAGLTNVVGLAGGYGHTLALVGDGRPVIMVQPFRRKLAGASQTRLQVMAVGAGPLSYQWQLNGTNIPGATGPVLLLGPGPTAGNYTVTVSNALGMATSTPSAVTPRLQFDHLAAALRQDGFHLRLLGLTGQGYVVIDASTNLLIWDPVYTNVPVIGTLDYLDPDATNHPQRFYRAAERDLALGPLRFAASLAPATGSESQRLRIVGLSGRGQAVLYSSTNLAVDSWMPVATNPPAIGAWEFPCPVELGQPGRFFRVLETR